MEDNEIRIVLKIPLMNTKQKYEVYKLHNLPMPLHHVSAESNNYLVTYTLEIEMPSIFILTVPRRYFCCDSLLLLILAVRVYTLVQLLC